MTFLVESLAERRKRILEAAKKTLPLAIVQVVVITTGGKPENQTEPITRTKLIEIIRTAVIVHCKDARLNVEVQTKDLIWCIRALIDAELLVTNGSVKVLRDGKWAQDLSYIIQDLTAPTPPIPYWQLVNKPTAPVTKGWRKHRRTRRGICKVCHASIQSGRHSKSLKGHTAEDCDIELVKMLLAR